MADCHISALSRVKASCARDARIRHMDDREWLAERFEDDRPRLRAVAYRMLGSITDAEDAVQDTWERVNRAGSDEVENLSGWLTTILARVCLNMLRARNIRREESLEAYVPDPIVRPEGELLPKMRLCWQTLWGSPCRSCSTPCRPQSGSPSSSTTCSTCPSMR